MLAVLVKQAWADHFYPFYASWGWHWLKQNPPNQTKVVLERIGSDYYLHKIWIEGEEYGYDIPLSQKAQAHKGEWQPQELEGTRVVG